MSLENAAQAKPNVMMFNSKPAPKATGTSLVHQNGASEPPPLFGGGGGGGGTRIPPPGTPIFGQFTAPRTAEKPATSNSTPFSFTRATSPSKTSTTSTSSNVQMWDSDPGDGISTYLCTFCKTRMLPSPDFCCSSCSNFYHRKCSDTGIFGHVSVHIVNYFGLDICENCHDRLQGTIPASFPITRPLYRIINDDTRSMPRRSNRDPKQIPRCNTPDQVTITAEHFTTEAENPLFKLISEITPNEPGEPMIEALFEINDPVIPIAFPRDHPDRSRPFKVTACYFNSKEYPEDDNDTEISIDSDQNNTPKDENAINKVDDHDTPDVFGKHGWFYKLERSPVFDLAIAAEVVLWHEDSLDLALDDDSNDEEDLDLDDEMEVEITETEEVNVEETVVEEVTVKEESTVEEVIVETSHINT